ncbi:Zinc resistance conferring protein [Exophiala xenobiotica]|nr:Zinc resistance conferring protein [Exophiala xenobiotica]KAK5425315.1 Zinc resistance conferring protein [Exophiala xenobiotica]
MPFTWSVSKIAAQVARGNHFNQFNDILSLLVGLWAIRVATRRKSSRVYTYGWQRAETLGALINGVFLVALCMSIFLEAIQRFAEPQEVSSPILILVVGCCGLSSNLLGMALLHEHEKSEPETSNIPEDMSNSGRRMTFKGTNIQSVQRKARSSRRAASLSQISIHPTAFRADGIAAAQSHAVDNTGEQETENTSPLASQSGNSAKPTDLHGDYIHARNDEGKGKGKGHDLNMAGVFLHVLGDAVGNIGVIASARFIWLTQFSWRFYTDPLVSIIITAIILHSAIPLCTAASRILLQAVPEGINVNEIKQDITTLPGVADYHALHVWQLSDTDVIATVHIEVDHKVVKDSHEQYIELASVIRDCLAAYGIHSATIQPEFFASTGEGTSTGRVAIYESTP